MRLAAAVAGAQLLAAGVLLVRVHPPLPEPVVLEIPSESINAHGDPRWVLLQDENALRILDPASLQVTATVGTGVARLQHGVAVRPGSNEGLALSGNAVVRVDLDAGTVVGSTPLTSDLSSSADVLGVDERGDLLVALDDRVSAVDLTDGSLSYVSSYPGAVSATGRLWDADRAHLGGGPGYPGTATSVALSPGEDRFYVFTNAPAAFVVDTRTNETDTIRGSRPIAGDVVLPTADGQHVVTIGGPNSTQVLVRGLDGTDLVAVQAETPIDDMDMSPDGSTVYATTGTQLLVVDTSAYT